MTDGEALLEAIKSDPADDVPRLAYADWLEEAAGGPTPRAEFIRVQVGIATAERGCSRPGRLLCDDPDCPERRLGRLERRERDLLFEHWPRWLHEAFDHLAHDVGVSARGGNDFGVSLYSADKDELGHFDCSFRRGFVSFVRCPLQAWFDHGAAVAGAHPVERVELTDKQPTTVLHLDGTPGKLQRWWVDDGTVEMDVDVLPEGIWELLHGNARGIIGACKEYESEEEAKDALSAALILWARRGQA